MPRRTPAAGRSKTPSATPSNSCGVRTPSAGGARGPSGPPVSPSGSTPPSGSGTSSRRAPRHPGRAFPGMARSAPPRSSMPWPPSGECCGGEGFSRPRTRGCSLRKSQTPSWKLLPGQRRGGPQVGNPRGEVRKSTSAIEVILFRHGSSPVRPSGPGRSQGSARSAPGHGRSARPAARSRGARRG